MATPMKKIRILALGTLLVLSIVMGAQAQTGTTSDSDQPTTQSEDKAAPTMDQQAAPDSEVKAAPTTDQQTASQSDQATPAPEVNYNSDAE
jgi:hypothetical protein